MTYRKKIDAQALTAVTEFVSSHYSGGSAHASIAKLIEATSSIALTNLDEWERVIRTEISRASNRPKKKLGWNFRSATTPFPTWIDLCNGDGFKRERTLRALRGPAPNAFFFALAIRRLNDWVPQVRSAAREKLPSIATESNPADVVSALCAALPHWSSWGRMETLDKQVLLEVASIEFIAYGLKSHIISTASGPLAEVLTQIGRTSALDASLAEIASQAIQPAVRAKAYRTLLEGTMVWLEGRKWEWTDIRYCKGHMKAIHGSRIISITCSQEDVLRSTIGDRSAMVRAVAGAALMKDSQKLGSLAFELAKKLASDKSRSISERGNFLLNIFSQSIKTP